LPRTIFEEDRKFSYEATLTKKSSLYDHLVWQMHLLKFSPEEKIAAEMIIGNLNDDGYLDCSLEEIATACTMDVEFVQKVLSRVQEFDPVGVAARNLQECLLLQAKMLGMANTIVEAILRDHLKSLEK
jgi:RNA polymerase sigma-54 factor